MKNKFKIHERSHAKIVSLLMAFFKNQKRKLRKKGPIHLYYEVGTAERLHNMK